MKLPSKFPDRPKCPVCGSFSTKPYLHEGSIVYYKCNNCGADFGIRKEEGWKRGIKYRAFELPIVVKVNKLRMTLTKKFIDRRLKDAENVALSFGIPMYGMSWIKGNKLYAKLITSTYKSDDNGYLVSVLLNGYPLYTGRFDKLSGEVVL